MAPTRELLALQEKKEEDSISKDGTDIQYKAPPPLPELHPLNKQFALKCILLKRVFLLE
jgi:hypothetical protein